MKSFDLVIIGSGPGGYVSAIRAGTLGLKTALVEKDSLLGGTCLHWGCIPTKALLHAAYLYNEIKTADQHGIQVDGVTLDFKKTHAHKKKIVRKLAKGIEYLIGKRKVERYHGTGTIADPNSVRITGENGEETIKASHLIVATGSIPSHLPHIVPDGKNILNSDHILELEEIPRRLAVIGAGAVGVEFASIFNSFGTEVHLIEILPNILPLEDREISQALEKALRGKGMHIYTSTEVKTLEDTPKGLRLALTANGSTTDITMDKVLVSVGRRPRTGDIGLDTAGIEMDGPFVKTNEFLQTNAPHIFAIGDIVKSPQLAHVASAEGLVAVDHIFSAPAAPVDYGKIPSCTYSQPEVASIGLKEDEAKELGYHVVVGRFPFSAIGKAAILGEPEGFVKIVAEKRYDEVLGVHIIGPKATELIAEAGAVLKLESTVEALTHTVHAHPTLSEAMMEAAHDVYGEAIHI